MHAVIGQSPQIRPGKVQPGLPHVIWSELKSAPKSALSGHCPRRRATRECALLTAGSDASDRAGREDLRNVNADEAEEDEEVRGTIVTREEAEEDGGKMRQVVYHGPPTLRTHGAAAALRTRPPIPSTATARSRAMRMARPRVRAVCMSREHDPPHVHLHRTIPACPEEGPEEDCDDDEVDPEMEPDHGD